MTHKFHTAALALALLVLGAGITVDAAPIVLSDGVWEQFNWSGGTGPISDPIDGFLVTVPFGFIGQLRVTDAFVIGDEFDVLAGAFSFSTSAIDVLDDGIGGSGDPDLAWADPRFSKGSAFIPGGTTDLGIGIDATRNASGFLGGAGFIRLDLLRAEVPEPSAYALFGTGLLLFAWRRRRSP